jgi:tetratricopeptide (TPR) repeat protein
MPRQDWFRNTDWNPEIKATFYKKLARARKKDQYLKIQAYYLSRTFPEVALDLLEEYFATGDKFFLASPFVTQASAHLSLGNIENAFTSYEHALNREKEFPHAGTEASADYPFLVATQRCRERYDSALEVLRGKKTGIFRIHAFKREAALALILADLGEHSAAREHSIASLAFAETPDSGLCYHPQLGTVNSAYEPVYIRLRKLAASDSILQ